MTNRLECALHALAYKRRRRAQVAYVMSFNVRMPPILVALDASPQNKFSCVKIY
jgi:hypothetical protein